MLLGDTCMLMAIADQVVLGTVIGAILGTSLSSLALLVFEMEG